MALKMKMKMKMKMKFSSHESYLVMKVIIVKEVMSCDVSPVVISCNQLSSEKCVLLLPQ